MVAAIAAAAWGLLRSIPITTGVAILIGVVSTTLQGYLPTASLFFSAVLPALPFFFLVAALLVLPGMRTLDLSRDPLATIDPPPLPTAAKSRAPQMDRIIRRAWWVLLAAFCVSMLTWIPTTWESVFKRGTGPVHRAALHYPDHGHGRSALAVPGHRWPASEHSPRPSWPSISG